MVILEKITFMRKLEIVSLIFTILGLYLLGDKEALGFLAFSLSIACQLFIFIKGQNWFLVVQMIILLIFNCYNYFKWIGIA